MKKFLKTFLLGFVWIIFIGYILLGIQATATLFKTMSARKMPVSAVENVVETATRMQQPQTVTAWIQRRPQGDTDELIRLVTPISGGLDSTVFFEFSMRRLRQDKVEDALNWLQLGRFRLKYDAVRCGAPNAYEAIERQLAKYSPQRIADLLEKHPELVKKSVRWAMDFDAKYPAANNPERICTIAEKLSGSDYPAMPEEQWVVERNNLRFATEEFLKEGTDKK